VHWILHFRLPIQHFDKSTSCSDLSAGIMLSVASRNRTLNVLAAGFVFLVFVFRTTTTIAFVVVHQSSSSSGISLHRYRSDLYQPKRHIIGSFKAQQEDGAVTDDWELVDGVSEPVPTTVEIFLTKKVSHRLSPPIVLMGRQASAL